MADPAASGALSLGLVAAGVAVFGPGAGEHAVIVVSALAGSLWALSRLPTPTRASATLLIARLVLTALVLTGALSWWLSGRYQVPLDHVLPLVAFFLAAIGDGWRSIINAVAVRLRKRAEGSE